MLLLCSTSASALIARVDDHRLSYEPAPAKLQSSASRQVQTGHLETVKPAISNTPVTYHGGPVMSSNTNYALYWDPPGASEYPAGYETGIDRYFEDVAHDSGGLQNTDSILTQYYDQAGEHANYDSHFAGALLDTDPYPANGCSEAPTCLTDAQLRNELRAYVEAHKLPIDLAHEYFVLTPPGVEGCYEAAGHSCSAGTKHAAYCAYHSFIATEKGTLVYADNPYVAGLGCDPGEEHPNDNPSDATIAGGLAHEHSESVTDPEINAWFDSKEEEVADKCRTFKPKTEFGEPLGQAPDGANYNEVINGDLYLYQQIWSNETGACEQRVAASPTIKKLAPKTGPTSGETAVKISGANFTSSATVKFGAAAATGVTFESSTSLTAYSPTASAGTVNVTVTTAAGTSAIVKKDQFKYKAPKK
ncbi:MAG TPA: IPT/TIG domain-containing protein [Solirubrobacteraceae bacterium]|nr:IPT/TIG domain-containing protein [Solirubrobacteraceae bacterium]